MEYNKLIAVTGMPGLFELVSSKNDGAIVRSLDDNTTKFVSSRSHQFSHLESIEVYTNKDNVNLLDVFKAIKDAGKALPDAKDNKALKAFFLEVYPDIDMERVYASDLKKMVKWYQLLEIAGVDIDKASAEANEAAAAEEESEEETEEEAKA
jgi:hypothetical protein